MSKLFLLGWILCGVSFSANADSLRDVFYRAGFTTPPMLIGTQWSCKTTLFNGEVSEQRNLFHFTKVLHNDYMMYSRTSGELPRLFPAWFSWNQTMNSTVRFGTRDFVNNGSCTQFLDCFEEGDSMSNKTSLRITSEGELMLEWMTSLSSDKLLPAVSDSSERAFAYSVCLRE